MKSQFNVKSGLGVALRWLGAVIAFVIGLMAANAILPLPKNITDATPPSGILSTPAAMLLNAAVNATILLWAARRSSCRGVAMWLQLLVLSFGVQAFQTQIETAYFMSAFPMLQGNFVVYVLMLRGFITSLLFTLLVVLLAGGFSHKEPVQSNFSVHADRAVRAGAWLAAVYVLLYLLFGYFVAWQFKEVRLFYGGPAQLNSFLAQWGATLMGSPELPVFQYFRGILWLLCLVPLFRGFTGRRVELVILSALALAYLPTIALMFPNPLMPAGVSLAHFWEVSISMGIFGALCAWFVPQATAAA